MRSTGRTQEEEMTQPLQEESLQGKSQPQRGTKGNGGDVCKDVRQRRRDLRRAVGSKDGKEGNDFLCKP
jgi:hypothetical protein